MKTPACSPASSPPTSIAPPHPIVPLPLWLPRCRLFVVNESALVPYKRRCELTLTGHRWCTDATTMNQAAARQEERRLAESSIAVQAEVISLRRKAAAWGASEDEETISAFVGRWEALSNWFPCLVHHQGVPYRSIEHAFQAAKAGQDAVAAEAIREAASPKLAHELGNKLPLPADWERTKRALMLKLLRDKFRRECASSSALTPSLERCAQSVKPRRRRGCLTDRACLLAVRPPSVLAALRCTTACCARSART